MRKNVLKLQRLQVKDKRVNGMVMPSCSSCYSSSCTGGGCQTTYCP
ncbi:hypothetical protein Mterra_03112 [Calidithermus terrae]|jgi:hypothetical protein|uniref:Uncharacterized protein n=1 Tax=Calidithermus terrae TaxID=1408545 RepID=A0A399EEC7_9DEIN|nr:MULTISPECIES: class III lanthipeptide [Calidithermus]RIH81509.1 hypothetical protein Mterra_03112 [Calidithermus terrae]